MNSRNQESNQGLINWGEQIGKIPFWSRLVYLSLVGCWLVDLITNIPSSIIASSLKNTFQNLFLWTIVTSSFYVSSFFFMTIVIFNFHTFLPKLQERFSTIVVSTKFLVNGAIITTLALLIQLLIGFEKPPINGVYGIWFNMLFKYCYFNAQRQIKFCCFNWKIKKTVYPLVLMALCIILSFSIPIDMIVGLIYGFLQVKFQRIFCFASGKGMYNRLSSFIKLDSVKCWIQYLPNREPDDFTDRTLYTNLENYQLGGLGSGDALDKSSASDPFASKKGVRIGDY